MMREGAGYTVPVVAAVVVLATFAGCLGGGEGRLIQTGSSTVLPLAIAWAEERAL